MKLYLCLSIASVFVISSCQSTNSVQNEIRRSLTSPAPTHTDFSRTGGLTSEQRINRLIPVYENALQKGDKSIAKDLAKAYYSSFDIETRKKSKLLLQELANQRDSYSIYLLSVGSSLGIIGELSNDKIETYRGSLEKSHPSVLNTDEFDNWSKIINTNFTELSMVYAAGLPLCQQKIETLPLKLSQDDSFIIPRYVAHCLSHYSVGGNIAERLNVISQFQRLHCNIKSSDKACISLGYDLLANNNITGKEDALTLQSISVALKHIYSSHKRRFKMHFSSENKKLVSAKVGKLVATAFTLYQHDEFEETLNLLKVALEIKNINIYDKAYVNRFLGVVTMVSKETDVDYDKAIEYLLLAATPNILNYEDHYETVHLLADTYLLNENYEKYIPLILYLVDRAKENQKLIPNETYNNLIELFGRYNQ